MATFIAAARQLVVRGAGAVRTAANEATTTIRTVDSMGNITRRALSMSPTRLASDDRTTKRLSQSPFSAHHEMKVGSGATPFISDQAVEASLKAATVIKQTQDMCKAARSVHKAESKELSPGLKAQVITRFVQLLGENKDYLLAENEKDCAFFQTLIDDGKAHPHDIDRLVLNDTRIKQMQTDALANCEVAPLQETWTSSGLMLQAVKPIPTQGGFSLPDGAAGAVFERRPNVFSDLLALLFATARPLVANGSSSAVHSNNAILTLFRAALAEAGLNEKWGQLLPTGDRGVLGAMIKSPDLGFSLVRGGEGLIKSVRGQNAHPVVITGKGNVHIFADKQCGDLEAASRLILESKMDRFVCNSAETLLLHPDVAEPLLQRVLPHLKHNGQPATIYSEGPTKDLIEAMGYPCKEVSELGDTAYDIEFEGPSIRILMADADTAIAHIQKYGTQHTECIITRDKSLADRFVKEVDAGLLGVNISTRHSDGNVKYKSTELGIVTSIDGPQGKKIDAPYMVGVYTASHLLHTPTHRSVRAEPAEGQDGLRGNKFRGLKFEISTDGKGSSSKA